MGLRERHEVLRRVPKWHLSAKVLGFVGSIFAARYSQRSSQKSLYHLRIFLGVEQPAHFQKAL